MQKILCFVLASSLVFSGCGLFRPSETWTLVRGVRVDTRGESDPSQTYAAALSARLAEARIEHKVVTYQFRYQTYLREEAIGTRTAVVYRDETHPANPWWLMEEQLHQPVWLPSDELGRQISFYRRDYAEVVEVRDVSGGGGGSHKAMLADRAPRPTLFAATREPGRRSSLLIPFRSSAARAAQLRRSDPERELSGKQPPLVTRRSSPGPARPSSRGVRDVPGSSMFYAMHRTAYDPLSAIDRRKMQQLRQGRVRGVKTARAY